MRDWSPLTHAVRPTSAAGRSSRRGATVQHIIIHCTAGGTVAGNIARFQDGTSVSCNYFVGDAKSWGIVPEPERAHTTGSPYDGGKGAQWDRESITIEIRSYLTRAGWTVAPEDYAEAVRLTAELCTYHGISIDALHIIGHRELNERYGAGYATECPAGIDMPTYIHDVIVELARAEKTETTPDPLEEQPMLVQISTPRPDGGYDYWLRDSATHTYSHVPTMVQVDFNRNIGIKTYLKQAPTVLDGYEFIAPSKRVLTVEVLAQQGGGTA